MGAGAPLSRKGAGVAAGLFEIGRNAPDQLVGFSPGAPSAVTASSDAGRIGLRRGRALSRAQRENGHSPDRILVRAVSAPRLTMGVEMEWRSKFE